MFKELFIKHSFEAAEFEKRTGLSGVSSTYILPHGLRPEELARFVKDKYFSIFYGRKILNSQQCSSVFRKVAFGEKDQSTFWLDFMRLQMLREIIHLNPELSQVRFNDLNADEVKRFLKGIASGYNAHDIQYAISSLALFDLQKQLGSGPINRIH